MASADPARIRQIKIKSGVVKRLAKEKVSYEKESEAEQRKVEKMEADGKDEYEVRKQHEVLEESRMMIPDCERRLTAAWDELSKMLETETDLNKAEEYKAAQEIINGTRAAAKR